MRWEYATKIYEVRNEDDFSEALNKMAVQGWEMIKADFIKVVNDRFFGFSYSGVIYVVFFKRPKNEDTSLER